VTVALEVSSDSVVVLQEGKLPMRRSNQGGEAYAVLRVFVNVPVNVKVDVTSTISGNPIVAATETPTAMDDSSNSQYSQPYPRS
jgi:hypothetical protein